MASVTVNELSDTAKVAQMVVNCFAYRCDMIIHSHIFVKNDTQILHCLRWLNGGIVKWQAHVSQKMMMATWSSNKKLCFVLVEFQFVCKHPFFDIFDTLAHSASPGIIGSHVNIICRSSAYIMIVNIMLTKNATHRLDIHGERLWADHRALRTRQTSGTMSELAPFMWTWF